jgi:hypothetical protein
MMAGPKITNKQWVFRAEGLLHPNLDRLVGVTQGRSNLQ